MSSALETQSAPSVARFSKGAIKGFAISLLRTRLEQQTRNPMIETLLIVVFWRTTFLLYAEASEPGNDSPYFKPSKPSIRVSGSTQ